MRTKIFQKLGNWASLILLLGIFSCNDMGYDIINNAIYISEANDNILQKVMVDEKGGKAAVSVRTNQKASQDIVVHVEEDAAFLEEYNNKMGTSYVVLPSQYYELTDSEVTIASGTASANSVGIQIKPLPDEITSSGKKYAIPVSIKEVTEGMVVLGSGKGIIYALDQIIVTSAPKLNGSNQIHYNFKEDPIFDTWAVEMMINMSNLGNGSPGSYANQCIFNAQTHPDAGRNTAIYIRFGDAMIPGNKLQVKLCGNVAYESNITFNTNEWYHLAFVYDGAKFRVYVDGTLDKESDANYGTFMFKKDGIISVNGLSYFRSNMKIREVRIWDCPITQTQIKDNMYTIDPKSEGLQGYWKMNEGTGSILHDFSENGNDAVIDGTPVWLDNVRSDQKSDNR